MNIDCNRCGARFDVSTDERRAFCPHCGETAVLPKFWAPPESWTEGETADPPSKRRPAAQQEEPAPPPTPRKPKQKKVRKGVPLPPPDHGAHRPPRKRTWRSFVFPLVAFSVLGSVIGLFFFGMKKVEGRASTSGWFGSVCLVDANGDPALDVAGFFGMPTGNRLPVSFFDGATGEKLWSGGSYDFERVKLLCLGSSAVGVDVPDTHNYVDVFPGKSPGASARVSVSGRIDSYGSTDDCVELSSGGVATLTSLDGKPVSSCKTERRTPTLPMGYTSTPTNNIWWTTVGKLTYVIIPDVGLTPYIIAAAFPGTLPLDPYGAPMSGLAFHAALANIQATWKVKLPYTVVFAAGVPAVMIDQTLVTWGNDPTRKDVAGVLIGINLKDGMLKYAMVQGSAWSNRLREIQYNGKYVVASWGTGVYGYDPDTGKLAWDIGGGS